MSVTYAIPDIHGRLDLLEAAIGRVLEHSGGQPATVVTLGDYIDRGPDSRQVIDRLICWDERHLRLVALRGNHEAMMWETCHNRSDLDWWMQHGGDLTLSSYGQPSSGRIDLGALPQGHLRWIAQLQLMHVDQHRVYVHAGLDVERSLDQQIERTLLWKRYPTGSDVGYGNRHIVHGHHADPNAPLVTKGRTNLDAMAWKSGRLVIGVFEDELPGSAIEFLEVVTSAGS